MIILPSHSTLHILSRRLSEGSFPKTELLNFHGVAFEDEGKLIFLGPTGSMLLLALEFLSWSVEDDTEWDFDDDFSGFVWRSPFDNKYVTMGKLFFDRDGKIYFDGDELRGNPELNVFAPYRVEVESGFFLDKNPGALRRNLPILKNFKEIKVLYSLVRQSVLDYQRAKTSWYLLFHNPVREKDQPLFFFSKSVGLVLSLKAMEIASCPDVRYVKIWDKIILCKDETVHRNKFHWAKTDYDTLKSYWSSLKKACF
jgi:hypothetical protein